MPLGNDAASFTTGEGGVPAVVNESVFEDTRPALESAETSVDGGQVILTFDEPVRSDDGVFEVAYGGTTYALSAESIVGGTLRLLLAVPVEADQTVTVSAPANAVQDLFGSGNEAIESQAVTNRVVVIESVAITSDPGTEGIYAIGDAVKATVTFSKAVTVTGTPELELDFDGEPRTADYDSGESSGAAVVFSYTVVENDEDVDGIAVGADSLALGGGTITAGGGPAHLAHDALAAAAGHRVDGVPPAPTGAATNADGTKVIVTFSEDLSTEDPVRHQYYQVGHARPTSCGVRERGERQHRRADAQCKHAHIVHRRQPPSGLLRRVVGRCRQGRGGQRGGFVLLGGLLGGGRTRSRSRRPT